MEIILPLNTFNLREIISLINALKYALINHKAGSNQCALDMQIDQPTYIYSDGHLNGKITFKIRRITLHC